MAVKINKHLFYHLNALICDTAMSVQLNPLSPHVHVLTTVQFENYFYPLYLSTG